MGDLRGLLFGVEVHMPRHHLDVMTQLSGIPILSPVLFMHVGDPYIHPLIYLSRPLFQTGRNTCICMYPNPFPIPNLHAVDIVEEPNITP